jgi:hypothetical protein
MVRSSKRPDLFGAFAFVLKADEKRLFSPSTPSTDVRQAR